MIRLSTPLKALGILALLFFAGSSTVCAQTEYDFVMGDFHTIDIREFVASLQWEPADRTSAKSPLRISGTPAPDNIRWIDRIYNLPDYMHDFYNSYGQKVKDVLKGETNYLSDPESDATVIKTSKGDCYLALRKINKKVNYTFSTDGITPEAKKQLAAETANEDAQQYIQELNIFIPYLFMSMNYDFPEAFWVGNSYSSGTSLSYSWNHLNEAGKDYVEYELTFLLCLKSSSGFDYRIEPFNTPEAVNAGVVEFKNLINNILTDLPNGTRYQQVRYLNDWLTKHNAYCSNYNPANAPKIVWSPMSALRGTNGNEGPVCEGYSRAFKILCNQINIPCMLAVGDAKSYVGEQPESHMWNEVKMHDGQWYAVDVTWNDPMSPGNNDKLSGLENEKWLLLGKNEVVAPNLTFAQSHPNSVTFGNNNQISQWDFDCETLIADENFDVIKNNISQPQQTGDVIVYSILGVKLGTFSTIQEATSTLEKASTSSTAASS